ncbi:Proline iminopeptidase [hydrothermal vent metagenome]|uniref:prolyl aminopeptidase n=1 Tax=hydrothermal vent metagenome TaxID=652676 RepID=A0A3B1AWG3_9ZZZZ
MRIFYPKIKPYQTHRLKVGDIHELYIEESGSADGVPVVFIHGGPGAGCAECHRRFFDPEKYHIILFDQRGAGQSTPHASLENNTTPHLVSDMEAIRVHLNIDKWVLFGGSWGSTLALVYAQTHPEKVLAMVLRGIFLCRPQEIDWFYQQGTSRLFPDAWQDYCQPIPKDERDNMVVAYYKRLTSDNDLTRTKAAKAWSIWEGRTSTLKPSTEVVNSFGNLHTAVSLARIECHYFMNNSFLEPNQLLNNTDKIKDVPCIIVQGRYDVVCPMESAWDLHQALPASELDIIPDAGHSAMEPSIIDALVKATDKMLSKIK